MGNPRSATAQRRVFAFAVPVVAVLVVGFGLLLDPSVSLATRQVASSAGLLLAGLTLMACSGWRAARTSGRRRRSWGLFTAAAGVAMASNVVGALVGTDNVGSPSLLTDLVLIPAMLLSIAGLVTFPHARPRGADSVVMTLDGLVTGGGVLAIAAVLVFPELLASSTQGGADRVTELLFPVLDIVLVTMALLLVLRAAGPDRPSLLLIGGGFMAYAVTDLGFAALEAQGEYVFGGRLDLGWIAGYLMISLAALYPNARLDEPESQPDLSTSSTRSAVLVFGVILMAGIVQVVLGEKLQGPTALLWLLLVLGAGARQALLAADNASLRRGLERRVREQTADLRRLARQNEVLLASVGDGVYGVDRAGRVTFVNPRAAEALGLPMDDLLGSNAHRRFHGGHDDDADAEVGGGGDAEGECYVDRAIVSGEVVTGIEDSYTRTGGARFPVEVTASPVLDAEDDEPRGAVVVFRDVTQRREVQRMKDEFLSVVSHELRTPLTAIRGSLGLLAGGAVGELGDRAAAMVTVAVESSERLTRLINDLLDIERMGSGARPMRIAAVEATDLVLAAVHQIEGLATPLDVRVELGTCEGRALVDEDQIMQTLTNLLGNAIKFSHAGGLVTTSAFRQDGHVVFEVSDEGRGIPADQLESVFEPFAQVDSSDARQKGGTGLGLAISRSIVERHGGRIWAESQYGVGTTVRFTLPAAP